MFIKALFWLNTLKNLNCIYFCREKFSIYANFENFTDTRQTRFGSIYTGTITNPNFRDIYAPLDGFIINAGVKLKL